MRKMAAMVRDGEISYRDFANQYKSWRGDKKRYNARKVLAEMDKLFKELNEHGKREADHH